LPRAWKSRFDPAKAEHKDHTAAVAGASWLVNGPFHPLWNWWAIAAISLRDIHGVPPANKRYPEAEWELMIIALDPACCPPDPDIEGQLRYLTPIDVVFQFDGVSEDVVREIVEMAVKAICDGRLSPDRDFRSAWQVTLNATVEHYKSGHHDA
jgi:hypothetical protein